jgi:hypothetical protein
LRIGFRLFAVELEITPEPDDAEREAIAAALADAPEPPWPYRSEWRSAAEDEGFVAHET